MSPSHSCSDTRLRHGRCLSRARRAHTLVQNLLPHVCQSTRSHPLTRIRAERPTAPSFDLNCCVSAPAVLCLQRTGRNKQNLHPRKPKRNLNRDERAPTSFDRCQSLTLLSSRTTRRHSLQSPSRNQDEARSSLNVRAHVTGPLCRLHRLPLVQFINLHHVVRRCAYL